MVRDGGRVPEEGERRKAGGKVDWATGRPEREAEVAGQRGRRGVACERGSQQLADKEGAGGDLGRGGTPWRFSVQTWLGQRSTD